MHLAEEFLMAGLDQLDILFMAHLQPRLGAQVVSADDDVDFSPDLF